MLKAIKNYGTVPKRPTAYVHTHKYTLTEKVSQHQELNLIKITVQ